MGVNHQSGEVFHCHQRRPLMSRSRKLPVRAWSFAALLRAALARVGAYERLPSELSDSLDSPGPEIHLAL
jgi:hypothetical protein